MVNLKKTLCMILSGTLLFSAAGCDQAISQGKVMEDEGTNAYVLAPLGENADETMPIAIYVSPTPSYTNEGVTYPSLITDEVYEKLSDLGINLIMGHNETGADIEKQMSLCDEFGMAYLLQVPDASTKFSRVENGAVLCYEDFSEEEQASAKEYLLNGIEDYADHKSFVGIKFWDEQGALTFPGARSAQDIFKQEYPDKLFYCNLLGGAAGSGEHLATAPYYYQGIEVTSTDYTLSFIGKGWSYYLEEYLRVLGSSPILSYDTYPWVENAEINGGYLSFLGTASAVADKNGAAFWNFVQTSNWDSGARVPNYNEMAYNINTSLMYGAQALELFNVINPVEFCGTYVAGHTRTPIDLYGNTTPVYNDLKMVLDDVRAVDHILMKSKFKGVMQSEVLGAVLDSPRLNVLESFNQVTKIRADFSYALAGCFNYGGYTALYIVNASIDESDVSNVYVDFDGRVKGYYILNGERNDFTGGICTIPALKAGQAAMLVLE